MASVQANKIGINEIIGALPTLTLIEVKELLSEAKKSLTEHEQRDDIARCKELLPVCCEVMSELQPDLKGDPMRETKDRRWTTARYAITLWLYQEMCFTMPVIRKAMDKSWSQVTRAVANAEAWFDVRSVYGYECALYETFRDRMGEELTHR